MLTAKKILRRKGAATIVAVLSATITTITYLGFKASVLTGTQDGFETLSFIPLYLSFLIPIFILDMLVKDSHRKRWIILFSALIAPFASFLDGWFSSELLINESEMSILLIPFMSVAGVIVAFGVPRFTKMLLTEKLYQQFQSK